MSGVWSLGFLSIIRPPKCKKSLKTHHAGAAAARVDTRVLYILVCVYIKLGVREVCVTVRLSCAEYVTRSDIGPDQAPGRFPALIGPGQGIVPAPRRNADCRPCGASIPGSTWRSRSSQSRRPAPRPRQNQALESPLRTQRSPHQGSTEAARRRGRPHPKRPRSPPR